MWKKSEYLKNNDNCLMRIHLYTALVMVVFPTYIHFFVEVDWHNIVEIFIYCVFLCIPVLVMKKWLHWIRQILKDVEKEYIRKSTRIFRIYWFIMILSMCIYRDFDNAVMIAVIIIWPFSAFILMCIRCCIFISVMEKHYPYIMHDIRKSALRRDNMETERILNELMEETTIPKVRKTLQMRKAIGSMWILHIYVWFVSLVFILAIYGVIIWE